MAFGVFIKETGASEVEPRFHSLSITSPALYQLSCAPLPFVTIYLTTKDRGVLLSALPKDTRELAGLFSTLSH